MRILEKTKDGGKDSPVAAYFLFEIKGLASIALLKFNKGRREAYHSHAFHALTWFIKGSLTEQKVDGTSKKYKRSLIPKITQRDNLHRVLAEKTSWCLTIRGPWHAEWLEYDEVSGKTVKLTHGRVVV